MAYAVLERAADGVDVVTLSAPEKMNAIGEAGLRELNALFDSAEQDPTARVLVVTGSGRGFCAGMDLTQSSAVESADGPGFAYNALSGSKSQWSRLVPRMRELRLPIVAAVNGAALGAGFAITLGADIRIASSEASFNSGYQKLGISAAEMGLSWIMPRLVGLGRATEILLTGRTVRAEEAERVGLVTAVVSPDELMPTALATASAITRHTPLGVWMTKDSLNMAASSPLAVTIEFELRSQILAMPTEDAREMRRAVREQRPPSFRGR